MPCASIFQSQTSKNDKSFVVGHIYIYQTRADNEGHQERASDTSVAVSIAGSGRVVVSISGSGSVAVRIAGSGQKHAVFLTGSCSLSGVILRGFLAVLRLSWKA